MPPRTAHMDGDAGKEGVAACVGLNGAFLCEGALAEPISVHAEGFVTADLY